MVIIMEAILRGETFKVEIVRKNNKNVYFRFKDGILYVTCNRFVSEREILKMINNNEDALYKMYSKVNKREEILFFY